MNKYSFIYYFLRKFNIYFDGVGFTESRLLKKHTRVIYDDKTRFLVWYGLDLKNRYF